MLIVLTGPKHCGKTTAGKALARLLGCAFTDLDGEIERLCGKSVRALYTESPAAFRAAEARSLATVAGNRPPSHAVLAAGGGLCDNGAAMDILAALKEEAPLVFLELSAASAWQRIAESARVQGALPPFLQTECPEETHRLLHLKRNAACKKAARITINAEGKNAGQIAAEIAGALGLSSLPNACS